MLDYAPHTLIMVACVVVAASLVKSFLGLGFGLIATPLLMLVVDPKTVPVFTIPLVMLQDALIVARLRSAVRWRPVIYLTVPAALTVPAGVALHSALGGRALQMVVSVGIIAAALLLLSGARVRLRRQAVGSILAGGIAGVLLPVAAVPGPPVALFMVSQNWEQRTMRAVLSTFFLALEAGTTGAFLLNGALSERLLLLDLAMIPPVGLAALVATRLAGRMSQWTYHRLVVAVIAIAGVAGAASLLAGL